MRGGSGDPRFYFDSSSLPAPQSTAPPRSLDTADLKAASASPLILTTAASTGSGAQYDASRVRQRRAAHWNEAASGGRALAATALSSYSHRARGGLTQAGKQLLSSSPLASIASPSGRRVTSSKSSSSSRWGRSAERGADSGAAKSRGDSLDAMVRSGSPGGGTRRPAAVRQPLLDQLDPSGPSELRPWSSGARSRLRSRERQLRRGHADADPGSGGAAAAAARSFDPYSRSTSAARRAPPRVAWQSSAESGVAERKSSSPPKSHDAATAGAGGEYATRAARRKQERERWRRNAPSSASVSAAAVASLRQQRQDDFAAEAFAAASAAVPALLPAETLLTAQRASVEATQAMQERIVRVRQQLPAEFLRAQKFSAGLQSFVQGFGAETMRKMLTRIYFAGKSHAFQQWTAHTLRARRDEANQRASHYQRVALFHKVAHKMLSATYDRMAFALRSWHLKAHAMRRAERLVMALRIQCAWRSFVARRFTTRRRNRLYRKRQRILARQLQRRARGRAARLRVARMLRELFIAEMATRIASRWRAKASKQIYARMVLKKRAAICTMQRGYRMHRSRNILLHLRAVYEYERQLFAAAILQRATMCFLARSELRARRAEVWGQVLLVMSDLIDGISTLVAARRLQRTWRRFVRCGIARMACRVVRMQNRNAVRRIAAVRVQTFRRNFATRRRVWQRLLMAALLLRHHRFHAAEVLQCHWRGVLGRRRARARRDATDACVLVQTKWRGNSVRAHSVVWQLGRGETRWRYAVLNLLVVHFRRRHLRRRVIFRFKRHREKTMGKAFVGWHCWYKQSKGMWTRREMGAKGAMLLLAYRRASRRRAMKKWVWMWKEIGDYLARLEEMRAYWRARLQRVTLARLRVRAHTMAMVRERHANTFRAAALSAQLNGTKSATDVARALTLETLHLKTDYLRWLGAHAKWRIERERIAAEACERGWRRNVQLRNWDRWWDFIEARRRLHAATRMGAAIWKRRAVRRFVGGILFEENRKRVDAMARHFLVSHFGKRALDAWRWEADYERGMRLRAAAGDRRRMLLRATRHLYARKTRKLSLRRRGLAVSTRRTRAFLRDDVKHWYRMWQIERMRAQHEAACVFQCWTRRHQAIKLVIKMRTLKAYQKTVSTERELDVFDLDGRNPWQHRECALDIRYGPGRLVAPLCMNGKWQTPSHQQGSLRACVDTNEWVLALVWAQWNHLGSDHLLPTHRALSAAAVEIMYRCGADSSVLTLKMRATSVVPANQCAYFRRRIFGSYSTKHVGHVAAEPQPETMTSLLHIKARSFPALRLFWKGRSFQPVGPWKRVCSDYDGPMEEQAIVDWVFSRKALAKVEAANAMRLIQETWRAFHHKHVFDAAATVQKWSRGYRTRAFLKAKKEAERKRWLMEQVRRQRAHDCANAAVECATMAAADAQWHWEDAHELVKWKDEQQWLNAEAGRRAAENEAYELLAQRHPRLFPDAPLCHCCVSRIKGTLPDSIFGPGMEDEVIVFEPVPSRGKKKTKTKKTSAVAGKNGEPVLALQNGGDGDGAAATKTVDGGVVKVKSATTDDNPTVVDSRTASALKTDAAIEAAQAVRDELTAAADQWREFADESSGGTYWYHETTGEASWETPYEIDALAAYLDSLPKPFVPPRLAMVACTECDLPFCRQCMIDLHSHGYKRGHFSVAIVPEDFAHIEGLCVNCTGRAGSIYCPSCDERFCPQCIAKTHAHGSRAHHSWVTLPSATTTLAERSHFATILNEKALATRPAPATLVEETITIADAMQTPQAKQRRRATGLAGLLGRQAKEAEDQLLSNGIPPTLQGARMFEHHADPGHFLTYFRTVEMSEKALKEDLLIAGKEGAPALTRSAKKARKAYVAALKARRTEVADRMKNSGWRSWNQLQSNRLRRLRLDSLVEEHRDLLRLAFDRYDEDGSETIDVRELGVLMRRELCEPMSRKQLEAAVRSMDDDGSGEVDFDEFARWFVEQIMLNPGRGNARMELLKKSLTVSKAMRKQREAAAAAKRVKQCVPGTWVRVNLRAGEGEMTQEEEDALEEMRLFGTKIPDIPEFGHGERPTDAAKAGVTAADRSKPPRPETVRAKVMQHIPPEVTEESIAAQAAAAGEGLSKAAKEKKEAEAAAKGLRRLVDCFDVQTWDGALIERVPWHRITALKPVKGQSPELGVFNMHMDDIDMFRPCLERYSMFRHGFAISVANSDPENVTYAFMAAFVHAWNAGGLPKSLYFEGREFIWPLPPSDDDDEEETDFETTDADSMSQSGSRPNTADSRPGTAGSRPGTAGSAASSASALALADADAEGDAPVKAKYFLPNVSLPPRLGVDRRLQPGWDNGESILWRMKWVDSIPGWTYEQIHTGGHNKYGDWCPPFAQREDPMTMDVKRREIMKCFRRYDVDDSGEIDEDELRLLLVKELAIPVTEESLAQAMKEMDTSGDGAIEPDELLKWFARQVS